LIKRALDSRTIIALIHDGDLFCIYKMLDKKR